MKSAVSVCFLGSRLFNKKFFIFHFSLFIYRLRFCNRYVFVFLNRQMSQIFSHREFFSETKRIPVRHKYLARNRTGVLQAGRVHRSPWVVDQGLQCQQCHHVSESAW